MNNKQACWLNRITILMAQFHNSNILMCILICCLEQSSFTVSVKSITLNIPFKFFGSYKIPILPYICIVRCQVLLLTIYKRMIKLQFLNLQLTHFKHGRNVVKIMVLMDTVKTRLLPTYQYMHETIRIIKLTHH